MSYSIQLIHPHYEMPLCGISNVHYPGDIDVTRLNAMPVKDAISYLNPFENSQGNHVATYLACNARSVCTHIRMDGLDDSLATFRVTEDR